MRALVCMSLIGVDGLEMREVAKPEPKAGEVRIDVAAAGLNYPDLLMLSGDYQHKPELPFVPGMEAAGYISAVGPGGDRSMLGRRVMVGTRGAFADAVVASLDQVLGIPEEWSFEAAAAFPVIGKTAFHALVHRAALKAGETLLVHGASGGTGHMAVKIGKALGARVVATTGDAAKASALRAVGADAVIDTRAVDLVDQLKQASGAGGVDVVFDPVGGTVLDASLKACAFGARILIVGFVAKSPNAVRTNYALIKGLSILGVRAGEAGRRDPAIEQSYRRDLPPLMQSADIRPLVAARHAFDDARAAFRRLQDRAFIGKIVLVPRL